MNDFSKISFDFLRKITSVVGTVFLLAFFYICFQIYVPLNPGSQETIVYTVQKGSGDEEIASDLKRIGIIRSAYFFNFYALLSLKHTSLMAGEYNLSSRMSIHQIASKMSQGDVIKNTAVILEGWDKWDIAKYLEEKNICKQKEFLDLIKKDYSGKYAFLASKPKSVDLDGFLFPDTYETAKDENCEGFLDKMLENFGKKITPEISAEIKNQGKTIFKIVTMASLIEKEVITTEDKKIVSGILWNRIKIGMPLQVDATINYITGKNDPGAAIKDTKINSPYNTYMYYGLPKGPISNPGIDSILAAVYPTQTDYLYYLTDGRTIFSKTLEEHNAAKSLMKD